MPGRDGTGPLGIGSMTGRGFGLCSGIKAERNYSRIGALCGRGLRMGAGYGCRQGRLFDTVVSESSERELFSAQKDLLEARLDSINKHLGRMQDKE